MRRQIKKSTFFRGREAPRLMIMVVMLVTLAMAIGRARQPSSWFWLTGDEDAATGEGGAGEISSGQVAAVENKEATGQAAPVATEPDDDTAKRSDPSEVDSHTTQGTTAKNPDDEFPPDIDPLEGGILEEDLQAMSDRDRSLGLIAREMPAYWRLMNWARRQSAEGMAKRKTVPLTFDEMKRKPAEHRAKLTRLKLNVRQVIKQPAEKGNPTGLDHVYELRGFTEESVTWIYYCIVPELPEGMPVGASVNEQVTFVGYFYKLQGYQAAGAKLGARPESAPLLIGRIVRRHVAPTVKPEDPVWAWWVFGAGAVVVVATISGWIFKRGSRGKAAAGARAASDDDPDFQAFALPRAGEWNDDSDDPADAWKKRGDYQGLM